jgi:transposase
MLEHNFEPEAGVRRVEVITGTGRRRRWSVDDKARIIAETLAPGAVTSEIARRHGMSPQQIFGWRREAKRRSGEGDSASCAPNFAPVVLETPATRAALAGGTVIEIIVGSLVARVPLGADGATLARVAQALKAAS